MKIFETGYSENFDGPGTRLIYYLKGCKVSVSGEILSGAPHQSQ